MANSSLTPANDTVDYGLLSAQVAQLAQDEVHWLPVLANAAALIGETLPHINWAGFYLRADLLNASLSKTELILGPFAGKVACVHIPYGKGVCGTAAASDEVQLVADVHSFPGHIACDAASRSEIVVPLHARGEVVGVLDIDSPLLARFDEADKSGLIAVAHAIELCFETAR